MGVLPECQGDGEDSGQLFKGWADNPNKERLINRIWADDQTDPAKLFFSRAKARR